MLSKYSSSLQSRNKTQMFTISRLIFVYKVPAKWTFQILKYTDLQSNFSYEMSLALWKVCLNAFVRSTDPCHPAQSAKADMPKTFRYL